MKKLQHRSSQKLYAFFEGLEHHLKRTHRKLTVDTNEFSVGFRFLYNY